MAPVALSSSSSTETPLVPTSSKIGTPAMSDPSNSTMNVSAVLHGANDLRITRRPLSAPSAGEVQLRIRSVGLCGSDLHYYLHGRNGDFALQHPLCLGHEAAGEIVALGPDLPAALASSLRIGDRVAIEAGRMCGACGRCKEGRYNLCRDMRFASSAKTAPHLDGSLQKWINWPAALVHRLPDTVSLTSAALCEPLSVVLQGLRRSNLQAGQSVLVLGAGAVGLLACAAAKASGASFVAAADIDANRLHFALANGWADAIHLLPPPPAIPSPTLPAATPRAEEDKLHVQHAKSTAADLLKGLAEEPVPNESGYAVHPPPLELKHDGFDLTFECTGVPACVSLSVFTTRAGGKTILIGMGNPIQTLPIGAAALREVDIVGVFRYANTYPVAIGLLAGGALRATGGGVHASGVQGQEGVEGTGKGKVMGGIENLVSHTYSLENAVEAFETLKNGKDQSGRGVVKVFIVDEEP